jgi:DNA replication protein DnaC
MNDFSEELRKLANQCGANLQPEEEVEGPQHPNAHLCRCREVTVLERGALCRSCREGDGRGEFLRDYFAPARASLPDWEHASSTRRIEAEILAAVDAWEPTSNLVLIGPTGAGKTTGAIRLALRLLDRAEAPGEPVEFLRLVRRLRFVSARDLIVARQQSPLGMVAELEKTARDASILILDEVGFERGYTADAGSVIGDVMDHRYDQKRITIVTSGMPSERIRLRYGSATWRRMHEPGGTVVELPGCDQ